MRQGEAVGDVDARVVGGQRERSGVDHEPGCRVDRRLGFEGLAAAELRRPEVEGPYSRQYAKGELRAEISSMMSGDRLQIGHDPARERDPDRDSEREPQRPRERGVEGTREADRDAAPPPPLPDPDRGGQYRRFQRAWSGPGR